MAEKYPKVVVYVLFPFAPDLQRDEDEAWKIYRYGNKITSILTFCSDSNKVKFWILWGCKRQIENEALLEIWKVPRNCVHIIWQINPSNLLGSPFQTISNHNTVTVVPAVQENPKYN